MRTRFLILATALVLGILAAVGSARYLNAERSRLLADNEMVTVLVASQDLPSGMTSSEIVQKKYVVTKEIPRQFVAAGAISSVNALDGKVVASVVSKDEQITEARFKYPADVGLASSTPEGFLAVSLPYEVARGVGGLIKPGDHVAVVGTFEGDEKTGGTSKIVISRARVLALGAALKADQVSSGGTAQASNQRGTLSGAGAQQSEDVPATITLALSPADAEKLVFTQEEGRVWLALYSPTDTAPAKASGVGYPGVLGR